MNDMNDRCNESRKDAGRCERLAGPGTVNKRSNSGHGDDRLHFVSYIVFQLLS